MSGSSTTITGYTVVGTPFSTFTRTITLALTHKNIPFKQITTLPRSDIAKQYHPLGFIPTLVIHTVDKQGNTVDVNLRETQAIARFIDEIAPHSSLNVSRLEGDGGSSFEAVLAHARVWEFVSLTASSGFPAVEVGVVKPRLFAMIKGEKTDEEMDALTTAGIPALKEFLRVAESFVKTDTPYLFASHPTWADFFLYPLLADLKRIPQWSAVESPRLRKWAELMEELPAAKATHQGTFLNGDMPREG